MSYVEIRQNPDVLYSKKGHKDFLEDALQELKRKMKKEGTLQDFRKHESYMSPSKKKRFKRNEAFKRRKREERKKEWLEKQPKPDQFNEIT